MGQAEKRQELERVLASATDRPHLILLWGHPDPDAIGSAMAHKRLCERMGASATIAHVLPVSRAENRALVKLLNVPMVKVTEGTEL
jgi:nanoRNase/pAp phosphatase (c-di-AMP/oligoRNAs hydrolase)